MGGEGWMWVVGACLCFYSVQVFAHVHYVCVVSDDSTAVVATKTSIVVAKDNTQVSALAADYEPQCVSRHPSRPEYAVGGKVSGRGGRWAAVDSAWEMTLVLTLPPGQQGPHPLPQWLRAERGQDC